MQIKVLLLVQNENQNNYEIVKNSGLVNSLFFNELKLLLASRFNNFTAQK